MHVGGEPVSTWKQLGEVLGENTVTFQNTLLGFLLFFLWALHWSVARAASVFPKLCRFPPIPLDLDEFEVPTVDVPLSPSAIWGAAQQVAILPLRGGGLDHDQGLSISQDAAVKVWSKYAQLRAFPWSEASYDKKANSHQKIPRYPLHLTCPWWDLRIFRPALLPTYIYLRPTLVLGLVHSISTLLKDPSSSFSNVPTLTSPTLTTNYFKQLPSAHLPISQASMRKHLN